MEHMPGTLAMSLPRSSGSVNPDPAAYDQDQIVLLGLADQLIDNYDRNPGNWLVTDTGNIHPIDHGMAFGYPDFRAPGEAMDGKSYGGSGGIQPSSGFYDKSRPGGFAANDMSPEDLGVLRSRLAAVEPDFTRLGRGDWYAKMLTRLDKIEQNATGTTRRLR